MAIGRYTYAQRIDSGKGISNPRAGNLIFKGVRSGKIASTTITLSRNTRLDQISSDRYGSASYWWVIAAASGIGWGLQLPAGTIVRIPLNLSDVLSLVR
tara:strand:- start:395 stop:691 length:297 start_codon:yes stop_codon:yes gene_type:complete